MENSDVPVPKEKELTRTRRKARARERDQIPGVTPEKIYEIIRQRMPAAEKYKKQLVDNVDAIMLPESIESLNSKSLGEKGQFIIDGTCDHSDVPTYCTLCMPELNTA